MTLVAQVYAALRESVYHRAVHVLLCPACAHAGRLGCWRTLRTQIVDTATVAQRTAAAEAKAAAEAEVARLATIAKAEADTKAAAEAAEAARLAVIARAKEEERRRQEEARLERERTKRIQIEAVSQKVLTELVEDHVAAAAGLARRAYSDEVQSVQLQRDVVTQGVDAELYAVANEVHAHESRIVRLNALEQEVRKRRVLRSWSQMTKRRQSATSR